MFILNVLFDKKSGDLVVFWENGCGYFFPNEFTPQCSDTHYLSMKMGPNSRYDTFYHLLCYDEITDDMITVPYKRIKLYQNDVELIPELVRVTSHKYFLNVILNVDDTSN